jgi:competence protein ComEA
MHTIARVLDGIGEKKAAAIVTYREEHGPFESVADLENVYGIGGKIIEKNLDKIVISQPATDTMSAESSMTSAVIDETKVPMNQSDVEETLNIQE